MDKMKLSEIETIIRGHELWLSGDLVTGKKADFSDRTVKIANFREVNMSEADFSSSELKLIEFVDANLENASFENATLVKIDFHGANLTGTSFKGATFKKVHIEDGMFNQIKGELTSEQRENVITSYKIFMRKIVF